MIGQTIPHYRIQEHRSSMREITKSLTRSRIGVCVLCLSFGLAATAWGQTYSGSLTGVVTDPSGAVIPGAKVTLTDVGKNIDFPALTNTAGRYVVRALPPSSYRLKVEVSGFKTHIQDDIVLAVNQNSSIDVSMQVGATNQTIEVTGGAGLRGTQDAGTDREVQRALVNEFPLLGRGIYDLATTAPGVIGLGGPANNFISSGSRNAQADIIVDGATTTNFEQNTGIQTTYVCAIPGHGAGVQAAAGQFQRRSRLQRLDRHQYGHPLRYQRIPRHRLVVCPQQHFDRQ